MLNNKNYQNNLTFKIIFALILFIAVFFRLYQIENIPPHPSLDEASIGYNAYSIAFTGSDEYGYKLPVLLRAYDDYRPALYAYLVIPFVSILGLDVISVRLPSVILSVLTVIGTYFITKELIKSSSKHDSKSSNRLIQLLEIGNLKFEIPLIAMLFIAISPWHIYISRLGHEANAAFSFFIIGLLFFLRYLNRTDNRITNVNLVLSFAFLALSFTTYQSEKITIPLFIISLFLLFHRKLLMNKKPLFIAIIIGIVIVLPTIIEISKPYGLMRFQGTNIFASSEAVNISSDRILSDKENNNYLGLIFDNRRFEYMSLFTRAYLSHFNPAWLFTFQEGEIFKSPGFGLFYLPDLPLLLFGFVYLVKDIIIPKKYKLVMLLWVAFSVLPGSLTTGYPHAMRIYSMLPVPQIICALGLVYLFTRFLKTNKKIYLSSLIVAGSLYAFFTLWFYHSYFVNFKRELSHQFQYGVINALSYAHDNEEMFSDIIVSNKDTLSQSYMYYLFSRKYDPELYQLNGGTVSAGYDKEHFIGKYSFVNKPLSRVTTGRELYIVNSNEVSKDEIKILKTVQFLNGKDAIWIGVKR